MPQQFPRANSPMSPWDGCSQTTPNARCGECQEERHIDRSGLRAVAMATIAVMTVMAPVAWAQPTKAECLDAHSRGQDAKAQGKLVLARKLFMSCAQAACPQLVTNDCAKWIDELARLQPTVTFAARDGSGTDLPDTMLYVDGVLMATRLDDGRPRDVDPGKHIVRFYHRGQNQTLTVVVGAGEQGRSVVATFGAAAASPANALSARPSPSSPRPADSADPVRTSKPMGAKVLLFGGAAVALGGAAFGAFELSRVPSNCSLSNHECSATPGDPVFGQAKRAVQLANVGWIVGGVGLAASIGGAIWYFTSGSSASQERLAVTPWASATGGGFALSGSM